MFAVWFVFVLVALLALVWTIAGLELGFGPGLGRPDDPPTETEGSVANPDRTPED